MELRYGVYCHKTTKRRAVEDCSVDTTEVAVPKKRRLPSATPQLQAFFNSHVVKPPPEEKLSSIPQNQPELFADENKFLDSLNPCEISSEGNTSVDKEHSEIHANSETEISETTKQRNLKIDNENNKNKVEHKVTGIADTKKNEENKKLKNKDKNLTNNKLAASESGSVASVSSQTQASKKPCENVQFYQMLEIPVDEAVRIKPPTPVESPTNFCDLKVKRNPEPKRPFVDLNSVAFPSVKPKNRRKQELPAHHMIDPATPRTPLAHTNPVVSTNQGLRSVRPTQPTGRFILLNPPPLNSSVSMHQSEPETKKARTAMSYGELSHAQAHKVALDFVRNMGKLPTEKRPPMPKRHILPKTSLTSTALPAGKVGSGSVTATSNIFQNEKNTFPITSLSKPTFQNMQQSKGPAFSAVQKAMGQLPTTGPTPERLLKQMAAAVANSNSDKKSSDSRNHPPPPYTVSSFVSYSLPTQTPIVSSKTSNSNVVYPGALKGKSNQPIGQSAAHHVFSLANQHRSASPQASNGSFFSSNNPRLFSVASHSIPRSAADRVTILKHNRPRMRYRRSGPMPSRPRLIAPHPSSKNSQQFVTPGSFVDPRKIPNAALHPSVRKMSVSQSGPGRGTTLDPRRGPFHYQRPASGVLPGRSADFTLANQNRPLNSPRVSMGFSGTFCHQGSAKMAPRPHPTNRVTSFKNPTSVAPSYAANPLRGAEKRKFSNPRRSVPSPPLVIPIGTRSPWSQRGSSILPDSFPNPEFASSSRKKFDSSPPTAHQHGPHRPSYTSSDLSSTASGDDSDQPLELTAKSRRPSTSSAATSQSATSPSGSDQPLCLIVKKH